MVIGLNSNNLGNWLAIDNATGKLGIEQLSSLDRILQEFREKPIKIVMLHHSPNIPRISTSMRRGEKTVLLPKLLEMNETERRRLRAICHAHKVRFILHGHVHIGADRRVQGLRIIGAAATTQHKCYTRTRKEYEIAVLIIKGSKNRVYRSVHKIVL